MNIIRSVFTCVSRGTTYFTYLSQSSLPTATSSPHQKVIGSEYISALTIDRINVFKAQKELSMVLSC